MLENLYPLCVSLNQWIKHGRPIKAKCPRCGDDLVLLRKESIEYLMCRKGHWTTFIKSALSSKKFVMFPGTEFELPQTVVIQLNRDHTRRMFYSARDAIEHNCGVSMVMKGVNGCIRPTYCTTKGLETQYGVYTSDRTRILRYNAAIGYHGLQSHVEIKSDPDNMIKGFLQFITDYVDTDVVMKYFDELI